MEDSNKHLVLGKANRNRQQNYYERYLEDPNSVEPSAEDLKCELQLSALSTVEPLNYNVDWGKFKKEISDWDGKWTPYLQRQGVANDREALLVVGAPGDKPNEYVSRPEACIAAGRELDETDFNTPTELFYQLESLKDLLNYWSPLGRTMLIKSNAGGYFPPHKDEPLLNRTCFRVAAFIGPNVDHEAFEWVSDGHTWPIRQNRAYYVDTRKTHRTHSWVNDSIHLIMNVPKTWENVVKLISATKHF